MDEQAQTAPAPATPPATPAPADPPPAAQTVQKGQRTEADVGLAREVEELRRSLKDREMTLAQREDELRRLTAPPAAPPTPKQKKSAWTLLDE